MLDKILQPLPSAPSLEELDVMPSPSAPPLKELLSDETVTATPTPKKEKTFTERLESIDFPLDQVPEDYLCPVSHAVMNRAVILPSGNSMDLECYKQLKIDPFNSELKLNHKKITPNNTLNAQIERFVLDAERKAREKADSVVNSNNDRNSYWGSNKPALLFKQQATPSTKELSDTLPDVPKKTGAAAEVKPETATKKATFG